MMYIIHMHRCGIRGGYMQLVGLDNRVMEQIYKHVSIGLCPNTPGQVRTYNVHCNYMYMYVNIVYDVPAHTCMMKFKFEREISLSLSLSLTHTDRYRCSCQPP